MSGTMTSWCPLRTSSGAKRKRARGLDGLFRQMPHAGLGEDDLERHSALPEGDQPLVPEVPRGGEIRQVLGDRAGLSALRSAGPQNAIDDFLQFRVGSHLAERRISTGFRDRTIRGDTQSSAALVRLLEPVDV